MRKTEKETDEMWEQETETRVIETQGNPKGPYELKNCAFINYVTLLEGMILTDKYKKFKELQKKVRFCSIISGLNGC